MDTPRSANITWHDATVARSSRAKTMGAEGAVVWMTGLSGSGKSTVAGRLEQRLLERGVPAYVLDGDNLRHGLNRDLGFAPEERRENIRRVGEVARLFSDACLVVITAFISPYRSDRAAVRALLPAGRFAEVYIDTPIAVCEARDPKGLYKLARAGEIPQFTGISAPYEAPESPEVRVPTAELDLDACAARVEEWLVAQAIIPPR